MRVHWDRRISHLVLLELGSVFSFGSSRHAVSCDKVWRGGRADSEHLGIVCGTRGRRACECVPRGRDCRETMLAILADRFLRFFSSLGFARKIDLISPGIRGDPIHTASRTASPIVQYICVAS